MALSNAAFQVVIKGRSLDFQTLRCLSTCRFPITLNGRLSSRQGTVQKQRGTALCETSICLRSRLLTSASLAFSYRLWLGKQADAGKGDGGQAEQSDDLERILFPSVYCSFLIAEEHEQCLFSYLNAVNSDHLIMSRDIFKKLHLIRENRQVGRQHQSTQPQLRIALSFVVHPPHRKMSKWRSAFLIEHQRARSFPLKS